MDKDKVSAELKGKAKVQEKWVDNATLVDIELKDLPKVKYENVEGQLKEVRVNVYEKTSDFDEKERQLMEEIEMETEERNQIDKRIAEKKAELDEIIKLKTPLE